MKHSVEEIAKSVNLDPSDILNVYRYGSRVYGTDDECSDDDYIFVHKGFSIKNSYNDNLSFRQNAISSDDGQIQVIRYSRSGFLDAIDNYEISALECLFLPEENIIKETLEFSIRNFEKTSVDYEVRRMCKKIITKASGSWFLGNRDIENSRFERSEKAFFHALRILMYGVQLKEHRRIIDYSEANYIWNQMLELKEPLTYEKVNKDFLSLRNDLMEKLKK